jgi:hypothetical protein
MTTEKKYYPVTVFIHEDVYNALAEQADPFKQEVHEIISEVLEDHVIALDALDEEEAVRHWSELY